MNELDRTLLGELIAALTDQTRALDELAASNDRVLMALVEQSDDGEGEEPRYDLAGRPLTAA